MFNNQEKKAGVKQAINTKAGADRRRGQVTGLRHKAHEEAMKQRRAEADEGQLDMADAGSAPLSEDPWAYNMDSKPAKIPVSLLPKFVELTVNGQTPEEVFHGTLMIRKLLSVDKDPPYSAIIETGVVPRLVQLLERNDYPRMQFEAAWALTNIAASTSENTMLLIQCQVVPRFVALLASPEADCRDQSAWAIGNLAGEGPECRNEALNHGAMPALLNMLMNPTQPNHVLRNAIWAASNLCRGKPLPALESVAIALPVLANFLNHEDEQLVVDAAWGISYISDGPDRVQATLEAGVLPRIVQLLSAPSNSLKTPAIRAIGNIAAGSDEQTQMIINAGALVPMGELLMNPKRALRKEACWTISNIAAGSPQQIHALVAANLFSPLLSCLQAPELDVRKEAVWSIANVTFCGTVEDIQYLVNIGVIPPLCDTLRVYDPKIVTVALDALQCFLQTGEDAKDAGQLEENIVAQQVMECGGIDHLEQLQKHNNKDVYNLALTILETYFNVDDSAPVMQGGNIDFATDNDGTNGSNQFSF